MIELRYRINGNTTCLEYRHILVFRAADGGIAPQLDHSKYPPVIEWSEWKMVPTVYVPTMPAKD